MKQQQIIPGILAVIAGAWLYLAITKYGVWNEGPRGGFMPMLAALITLGFSLGAIFKAKKETKPWYRTVFIPVLIVIALIFVSRALGLLPSLFLMLLGWFRFLEKYSWTFTATISVCVIGCVWLIFSFWLKVPFPTGWLGNLLG